MLDKSVLSEENFIYEYFIKNFEEALKNQNKPLTRDAFNLLTQLLLVPHKPYVFREHDDMPFVAKMMMKRAEVMLTVKIDDARFVLFLAYMAETPGKAVMWITYLDWYCIQNNIEVLSFEEFIRKVIPHGYPDDTALRTVWEAQKINIPMQDNLVDYYSSKK